MGWKSSGDEEDLFVVVAFTESEFDNEDDDDGDIESDEDEDEEEEDLFGAGVRNCFVAVVVNVSPSLANLTFKFFSFFVAISILKLI